MTTCPDCGRSWPRGQDVTENYCATCALEWRRRNTAAVAPRGRLADVYAQRRASAPAPVSERQAAYRYVAWRNAYFDSGLAQQHDRRRRQAMDGEPLIDDGPRRRRTTWTQG